MRTRGLTLLEVLVATTILTIVIVVALSLLDTGNRIFEDGSMKQLAHVQAQRVLDQIADDFRNSAAWNYFQIHNAGNAPGSGTGSGDSLVRLTKFYSGKGQTSGYDPANQNTPPAAGFSWGPFNASTDGVAFLRVRAASASTTTVSGYQAYLVLDFEPREAAGSWPAVGFDVNGNGASPADNQPGRMDDDPHRMYILYRTRSVQRRVIVERVRGIDSITNDGSNTGNASVPNPPPVYGVPTLSPQEVTAVGDLGPDSTVLPSAWTQGSITLDAVPVANSPTGVGNVHIHVIAHALAHKGKNASENDVYTADLETTVSIPCATPPF